LAETVSNRYRQKQDKKEVNLVQQRWAERLRVRSSVIDLTLFLWYHLYHAENKGGGVVMSTITKQDVEHVAHLARLALTAEEAEKMTKQLDSILAFVEKLNELDTTHVEPTSHVLPLNNVTRADEVRPSLPVEEALKNTAEHRDQQVKVPSVLEG
jgi:aspartyl-tRNA(Asn)/glutamyl-tRNA(Gln) amidotransferase subunit C